MTESTKLIECPRDAWQGLPRMIPTDVKAAYLAHLISAGFQHIDAVSFVSPKHVPQMADSEAVLRELDRSGALRPDTEIIAIVVNEKGLERALAAPGVTTIGYPHSISGQFARSNANMSVAESRALAETLRKRTADAGRGLVVYISMAFGNPYGEPWSPELVEETAGWLGNAGVGSISLADTVGTASPGLTAAVYKAVAARVPGVELGLHLHSRPEGAAEKVLAAYRAGCRRFDSALTGLGGCPFAGDGLVGNVPTEIVATILGQAGAEIGLDAGRLQAALLVAGQVRKEYAEGPEPPA